MRPYGPDQYRDNLGPSELFAREKFIFVYQDVRGRYMSEGKFVNIRPHNPSKGPKDIDESTDTHDTIDWTDQECPRQHGKGRDVGASASGFYVSAGMIDAHPALVAASPQAPVTDYYLGDDNFHNGAFMLAANFRFYLGFFPRPEGPDFRRRTHHSTLERPTDTSFSREHGGRYRTRTKILQAQESHVDSKPGPHGLR